MVHLLLENSRASHDEDSVDVVVRVQVGLLSGEHRTLLVG